MTHDQCEELIEALDRIGSNLFDVSGALYDIKDAIDKIPYYDDEDLVAAVDGITHMLSLNVSQEKRDNA